MHEYVCLARFAAYIGEKDRQYDSQMLIYLLCVPQYIFISLEEMTAVAQYIQQRGRVAISDLAAKSSMFIALDVKDVAIQAVHDSNLDADIFGKDNDA